MPIGGLRLKAAARKAEAVDLNDVVTLRLDIAI